MDYLIEVKNLSKTFVSNKKGKGFKGTVKALFSNEKVEVQAVNDVSFNIKKGEIIGYIGANGAGKSTTIKMMTGILTPTDGQVVVDGRIPYKTRTENAKNIGVVFGQKTQLWWDLPLGETYDILKEIYQVPDDMYKEQMAYFSEVLGIDEFMDKTVRTLSLGQRMRADLAASMLHNPKVIYLDEPTIGLDVVVKEKIRKAIKELNEKYKTTIILTTHDMSDIEELCSRIMIIDKGQIIYDGDIEKIRTEYGYMRSLQVDMRYDSNETLITVLEGIYDTIDCSREDLAYEVVESGINIDFNRNKIKISEVMDFVLKQFEVMDFSIKDMDIESIVKGIYLNMES